MSKIRKGLKDAIKGDSRIGAALNKNQIYGQAPDSVAAMQTVFRFWSDKSTTPCFRTVNINQTPAFNTSANLADGIKNKSRKRSNSISSK